MPRAEINNLGSLQNTPSNVAAINQNFERILQAIEDAVSRTGQAKTYMEGNIDANSKRIFNLPFPLSDTEPLRKKDAAVFSGLVNINDQELYDLINQTIIDFGTSLDSFEAQLIAFGEQLASFEASYAYFESILEDLPTTEELEGYLQQMRFPIGSIVLFPVLAVPDGYLRCEGQFLDPLEYPALFEVIGTTYGGDGVTTFRLPDTRGEFVRGFDNGRGVDTGRTLPSSQSESLGAHKHYTMYNNPSKLSIKANPLTASKATVRWAETGGESNYVIAGSVQPADAGLSSDPIGGSAENRPRNVVLVYCIKAFDGVTFGGNRLIERLRYEVQVSQFYKPDENSYLFNFRPENTIRLPADFAGSVGYCDVAPTLDYTYTLKVNDVAIGTATFLAGQTTATFSTQPTQVAGAGAKVQLVTDTFRDATLANVSFRIKFVEV